MLKNLLAQDPTLCPLYERYGFKDRLDVWTTDFWHLVRVVNAQLISTSAADTILGRLDALVPENTPEQWLRIDVCTFRNTGLSKTKIHTLHTVADDIVNGTLCLNTLQQKPFTEFYNTLIAYKGIGNWTANCMGLTVYDDIFLYDDLGVRDGVKKALGLPERPSIAFCKTHYEKHWKPYGTTATWLMWHLKHSME